MYNTDTKLEFCAECGRKLELENDLSMLMKRCPKSKIKFFGNRDWYKHTRVNIGFYNANKFDMETGKPK